MARLSFESWPVQRRRRALGLVLLLVVLALHAVLLGWAVPAWFDEQDPTSGDASRVVVHRVQLPPATPAPRPPAVSTERAQTAVPTAPRPVAVQRPAAASEAAAAAQSSVPEVAAAEVATPSGALEPPVYAPKLPAAGTWHFQLQRGPVFGEATLSWVPQADGRYEVRLTGRVAGAAVLDWVSRGAVDATGLAPERFALRRRGRDQQAANFQRDAGKITFSGPTHELPLWPGAQDRLSWLLQLAGIVEAEPAQRQPGARITMMVVGARGGGGVWNFEVLGEGRVGGRPALRLLRDAQRPYDTRAEVWLDPARGHLPLRVVLAQVDGGPPLTLVWQDATGEDEPVRP